MIDEIFQDKEIVYVSRDIERAEALLQSHSNIHIITNKDPQGKKMHNLYKNQTLLISGGELLDTQNLLERDETKKYIAKLSNPHIVVFKNTGIIEKICAENNWKLLNPSATLAGNIENKLSQIEWLSELTKYLPEFKVETLENIDFDTAFAGNPFILQYNRAHTGSGTLFIENAEMLEEQKEKFPKRPVKISKFIEGVSLTSNNIVSKDNIFIGSPSYQITGIYPFTAEKFATIGNDWGLGSKIMNRPSTNAQEPPSTNAQEPPSTSAQEPPSTSAQEPPSTSAQEPHSIIKKQYEKIVTKIGEKLQKDGWRGLFGVDLLLDEESNTLYLIEINARQPASSTAESKFQKESGESGLTTLEAHALAMLDAPLAKEKLIEVKKGSQIIQRITPKYKKYQTLEFYKEPEFEVIFYNNSKDNSDLIRMRFKDSVMKSHNELSTSGTVAMDFSIAMYCGQRWNSPRAGIILEENGKILLIKRHKFGRDYYVIPGGTLENDETPKQTAIREVEEEASIVCELEGGEPLYILSRARDEYYFFSNKYTGEVKLGGEEAEANSARNSYELVWVGKDELEDIQLFPEGITEKILDHEARDT